MRGTRFILQAGGGTDYKWSTTNVISNAFTPNGDGHNDVLRPIAAGIRELKFFSVFNRWGELVFNT